MIATIRTVLTVAGLVLVILGGAPVRAQPSTWTVDPGAHEHSMSVVAEVTDFDAEQGDALGFFAAGEVRPRGVATPTLLSGKRLFFATVHGGTGDPLEARFYDASSGIVYPLAPGVTFAANGVLGETANPVAFSGGGSDASGGWRVDPGAHPSSMTIVAQVLGTSGEPVGSLADTLVVRVGSEVRGVGAPVSIGGIPYLFVTVYGTQGDGALSLTWYASGETPRPLQADAPVSFVAGGTAGGFGAPLRLRKSAIETPIMREASLWSLDPSAFGGSMTVVGVLSVENEWVRDDAFRVAAFVDGELRGVAQGQRVGGQVLFFLVVYGDHPGGAVAFRAHAPGLGVLVLDETLTYQNDATVGTPGAPFAWDAPLGADQLRPDWWVDASAFSESMTLVATVDFEGRPSAADRDLLAVVAGGVVRGVAALSQTQASSGQRLYFVTIYGGSTSESLTLEAFDSDTGQRYSATEPLVYAPNRSTGSVMAPRHIATSTYAPGQLVVWPGDADNNGIVNQNDLLPISTYFGRQGPGRTSMTWAHVLVSPWPLVRATYADTDGNGTVNQNDLLPLANHFGRTTGSVGGETAAKSRQVPSVSLDVPSSLAPGEDVVVQLRASSAANLQGVGGQFGFDLAALDVVRVEMAPLVQQAIDRGQAIHIVRLERDRLALSLARTDGFPLVDSTEATLATIHLRARDVSPATDSVDWELGDLSLLLTDGYITPAPSLFSRSAIRAETSTSDTPYRTREVRLGRPVPNPARAHAAVEVVVPSATTGRLTLYNVVGREAWSTTVTSADHRIVLPLAQMPAGLYLVRLVTGSQTFQHTLTVVP